MFTSEGFLRSDDETTLTEHLLKEGDEVELLVRDCVL